MGSQFFSSKPIMLCSQQMQTIRVTIHSLLAHCNVPYRITPFDHDLYQDCVDEAVQRGYPMEGDYSVRTFLQLGVEYAETAAGHLTHRANQIWVALFTSCAACVDDAPFRFPAEIPNIYLFNERFIAQQQQGNLVLDALADLIHQVPNLFGPIPSKLVMTSCLNFVTANLLEYETTSMQIASAAQQYPIYQRKMTGLAEGYAYMAFSREVPVTDYVQAIPEIMLFVTDVNDVLSFYKEELAGEVTNQISTMAARGRESHLKSFVTLAETVVGHYRKILKILEESPVACEEAKRFCAGYIDFHLSSKRYKLADLNL